MEELTREPVKTRVPCISRQEFESRQEICRRKARDLGFDGLFVVGGPFYDRPGDLAYLTGHYPPFPSVNFDGEYRGLGFGVFILPVSGRAVLVCDTQAYRAEWVVADEVRPARNLPSVVRSTLSEMGLAGAKLGFVGLQVAPWTFVQEIFQSRSQPEIADPVLRALRRRKSPAEISLLREAAEVAEIGIAAAMSAVAEGRTESEVCAEGIRAGLAAGADFVRYLRVLSGPFSGWPHRWPPATERVIKRGETVCMDYIGAVTGYQFDILRTAVAGSPDLQTKELINLAIESTKAAVNACGPDVPVKEVIRSADSVIERGGFSEHRAKFTGHGIGLDTVEAPFMMAESSEVLQVGDVLCLEPGILIRDIKGARFEYEVVITENGCELLAGRLPEKS